MQILSIKKHNTYHPNTPNFKAMKKSQFVGIDRFVVESFKAPIEKFNVWSELQTWAKDLTQEISSKEFLGRSKDTIALRKKMIQEWFDYVTKENDAYTWAMRLLVMAGITQGLKKNEDSLPPVLNKGVLADTLTKLEEELISDPKKQFNFNKTYQNNLRAHYTQDSNTGETETKWVVIPSAKHDTKNFKTNIEKLKTLSYKTWCTKSFNSKPYLEDGDFHVFLENGQPKLGVRFVGNLIAEIQGELNNGKIPIKYLDILKAHLEDGKYKIHYEVREKIENAERIQKIANVVKQDIAGLVQIKDYKRVLKHFKFWPYKLDNGNLEIESYKQPSDFYTWSDIGVDENELLENVEIINGNASFTESPITELKHIKKITGNVYLNSQISSLGDLEYIGGNVDFSSTTDLTSLGKLKHISGNVHMPINENIKSLGNLETIGGNANLYGVSDLGNLKRIGKSLKHISKELTTLGNLEEIGEDVVFSYSNLTSLGKLRYINGKARFSYTKLDSLGELKYIGGDAFFDNSKITSLGELEYVGRDLFLHKSQVTSLGNLNGIGRNVRFENTLIKDLNNLEEIGGDLFLSHSKVESLGKLRKISGDALFGNSLITSLGKLETIGGRFILGKNISSLGKLKEIGDDVYLGDSILTAKDFKKIKVGGRIFNC